MYLFLCVWNTESLCFVTYDITYDSKPQQIHSLDVTSTGKFAFTINASDPENDRLTYSLNGIDAGYFKVDANNGMVSVNRQLDREVWCSNIRKTFSWFWFYVFYQFVQSRTQVFIFYFFYSRVQFYWNLTLMSLMEAVR